MTATLTTRDLLAETIASLLGSAEKLTETIAAITERERLTAADYAMLQVLGSMQHQTTLTARNLSRVLERMEAP